MVAGGVLGGLATAAHDFIGVQRLWRSPPAPLRVLITGGSSGVGKALAREFLRQGSATTPSLACSAGRRAGAPFQGRQSTYCCWSAAPPTLG